MTEISQFHYIRLLENKYTQCNTWTTFDGLTQSPLSQAALNGGKSQSQQSQRGNKCISRFKSNRVFILIKKCCNTYAYPIAAKTPELISAILLTKLLSKVLDIAIVSFLLFSPLSGLIVVLSGLAFENREKRK